MDLQQPFPGGDILPVTQIDKGSSLPSTPSSGPVSPALPAALLPTQPTATSPTTSVSSGRESPLPVAPVIYPQPLPSAPYTASPYSIELPPSSSNDLRRALIRTFHESGVDAQFISPFQAQCYKRACAANSEFFAQAWNRGHLPHKAPGFLLELSRVQGDVGNFVRAVECIRGVVLKKWGGGRGGGGGEEDLPQHAAAGASASGGGGEKVHPPHPVSTPATTTTATTTTPAAITAGKVVVARRLREESLINLADTLFDSDPGQAEDAAHAVTRMAMNAECLEELGERARAAHLELMVGEVGEDGGGGCASANSSSSTSTSTASPTKPPVGILQILSALLKRVCGDLPGGGRGESEASASSSGGGGSMSTPTTISSTNPSSLPPSLSSLSSSSTVVDSRSASAFALSTLAVNPHCASALGALLGGLRLLRTISHLPAGEAALAALRREAARTVMRVYAAQGGIGGVGGERGNQGGPEWEEWEALLMALMDDPEGEVRDCAFALISAAGSPLEKEAGGINTVASLPP